MGKRIEITARDIDTFRHLRQYRYLSSTYILAFVGGASETRFKERLGDLFHEGYVNRPDQQWQFAKARCAPAIYEQDDGAKRVLRERGDLGNDGRTFLASNGHRQFAHTLLICDVLASVEIGARNDPTLRFISWPEILARAPENVRSSPAPFRIPLDRGCVVPDGLFGLEYSAVGKKMFRFFALEADRGTMPVLRSNPGQTSYMGKLDMYREVIARKTFKTHLGLPNLLVLTVTTSDARKRDMMARLTKEPGDNAALLFKALPDASYSGGLPRPELNLLLQPWDRAQHPPLAIQSP